MPIVLTEPVGPQEHLDLTAERSFLSLSFSFSLNPSLRNLRNEINEIQT